MWLRHITITDHNRGHVYNPGQSQRPFLVQRGGTQTSTATTSAPFPSQEEIHHTLKNLNPHVQNFPSYVETTVKPYLQSKVDNFRGGQLSEVYSEWQS